MSLLKKILMMDDDPDHLLFCSLVFERRGYEVKTLFGCDPDEFLQILNDFGPDLIFLDHQMRGISGPVAIQTLRYQSNFPNVPVVYCSAAKNIAELARSAGANAFLKKPFTIQRLIDLTSSFEPPVGGK